MLALVSSPSKYASPLQTYSFMCNISALDYRKTLCELAKINDRKRLQKLPWLMPPIKPPCTTQRTETDQMRKRELKVLNSSLFKYICSRWEERRKTKYVFLCLRKKCFFFFFFLPNILEKLFKNSSSLHNDYLCKCQAQG